MIRITASRPRGWALVCGLVLSLGTLASAQDGPRDPRWEKAYAHVDGVAILRTAVDVEAKRGIPKHQVLRRLITMEVMRAGLLRAGKDPTSVAPKALDEALDQTRQALKARGSTLKQILERSGQTLEQFREDLRLPLALREFVQSGLTDQVLRKEFEQKKVLLGGEARISHVLVAIKPGRSRTQARQLATQLLTKLGKAPTVEAFAKLASERSDDPMASLTGGDLDWARAGDRRRDLPGGVLRAALAHGEVGLLPSIVDGPRGVHLVYVSQVRVPKAVTYERFKEQLQLGLEQQEVQRLVSTWQERARVEYAPDAPREGKPGRAPGSLGAPRKP